MVALVVAPVLTGQGAPVMKSACKKTRSPEISVYLHQDTLGKRPCICDATKCREKWWNKNWSERGEIESDSLKWLQNFSGGGTQMDGFEKLLVVRGLRLLRLARVLRMVGRFKAHTSQMTFLFSLPWFTQCLCIGSWYHIVSIGGRLIRWFGAWYLVF